MDERRFQLLADSVGDSAFLEEMVTEFLAELTAKFKGFPKKLANEQFGEIAHVCHKYKSTSGTFGMEQLAATLLLLEKASQDRNPVEIQRLMAIGWTDWENASIAVVAMLAKTRGE